MKQCLELFDSFESFKMGSYLTKQGLQKIEIIKCYEVNVRVYWTPILIQRRLMPT